MTMKSLSLPDGFRQRDYNVVHYVLEALPDDEAIEAYDALVTTLNKVADRLDAAPYIVQAWLEIFAVSIVYEERHHDKH
jgi:hypothetical protein